MHRLRREREGELAFFHDAHDREVNSLPKVQMFPKVRTAAVIYHPDVQRGGVVIAEIDHDRIRIHLGIRAN